MFFDKVCYVGKKFKKKLKFYNFIKVIGLIKIYKNKFDLKVRIWNYSYSSIHILLLIFSSQLLVLIT